MPSTVRVLSDESLIIVFASASAGLGHLRVTDALYHGLPDGVQAVLLNSQDATTTTIHRITSIHPIARRIFEWAQNPPQEHLFMRWYRSYLQTHTDLLYSQLVTVMEQRLKVPETMLVVATHFGLAHQLSVIKERLEKEKKIRLILAVQITDDSPMDIWYVPGADLIFAPSHYTRRVLERYGKKEELQPAEFIVNPYPVSTLLSEPMSERDIENRRNQLDPDQTGHIHLAIPVSGAAVGMEYFTVLINTLHHTSDRFRFHIVSKITPHTQHFLNTIIERADVKMYVSTHEREVVDRYEQMYMKTVISLEVTKPSEQAFKSLLRPGQKGGAILLFAEPVGRQEYDNIQFMMRHGLIPTAQMQHLLWKYAHDEAVLDPETEKSLQKAALAWRGVQLPHDPSEAARCISWMQNTGIFLSMSRWHAAPADTAIHPDEVSPYGVKKFWDIIASFLSN